MCDGTWPDLWIKDSAVDNTVAEHVFDAFGDTPVY